MIGIFDSGSGGLSVLRAIREYLPSADVLYFGDIKNVPYGSKSREELSLLTIQAIQLLHERGARSIVSACNSVSASLAISLFDAFSISPQHLIEMVGPTVSYFRKSPSKLLLCATPATIRSDIYQSAFRMVGKDIECVAIPQLASAIEFGAPEAKMEAMIKKAFEDINIGDFDALVLACTHYPLVTPVFRRALGESIVLFDPALAVAARVEKQLWPRESGYGETTFIISKDSEHFRRLVAELFPERPYSIEVLD
jgi:glutamate racemase